MRYYITTNFKNLSMNCEKYIFYWEKLNFEPTGNSAYKAEFLALGYKFTFNNDFMMNRELILCKS